jgi:hypothetical protein
MAILRSGAKIQKFSKVFGGPSPIYRVERQAGKKAKTNAETRHHQDNLTAVRLLTTEYLNPSSFFILVRG